jgi:hypothetical protein
MRLKQVSALLIGLLMVSSIVAAPIAAQSSTGPDLNFSDDQTPNPYIQEDTLTVAQHDRSEMSSPLHYYDDSGDVARLPAQINDSQDTPVTIRADKIDSSAYTQFPRDKNVSAINASEWSASSGASSSMTISQTNGATASGVDSINLDASVVDGETATGTYSNFSVEQDPEKRVLRLVGNVDQLSSGATVDVRLVDSDGDAKVVHINGSASADDADVIGTGTGQGYVFQERLGDLATDGSNGDGVFDGIQKVEVVVSDADAELTLVGLDAESKSQMLLGETVDSNDEVVDVHERNAGGDMSVGLTSLNTMGSSFDDAVINDLEVSDVRYQLSDLTESSDYSVEFSDADAYSYPRKLEMYGRLSVPAAIDLTHSGLSLEAEQGFVSQRYATVQVAEGVGDQEFQNISSWTDAVDKEYGFHLVLLLQDGEEETMKDTSSGGGGFWGGGGNPVFQFIDWVIAGVLGIAGTLGIARARS